MTRHHSNAQRSAHKHQALLRLGVISSVLLLEDGRCSLHVPVQENLSPKATESECSQRIAHLEAIWLLPILWYKNAVF